MQGVWVRSITVEGFRGVGPAATLRLDPGPGLTLVLGRNGSGKSSFADGAEVALTGSSKYLLSKTADWRKQWRNIHDAHAPAVAVELQVDGEDRLLTVRRQWTGKDLADSVPQAQWDDGEQHDLASLGWSDALERYRPFLSYDDLGKVSDKPSTGFDHLIKVLGIEAITQAQMYLSDAKTEIGRTVSAPHEALPALLRDLDAVDDDRARRALRALTSGPPDVAGARESLVETPEGNSRSSRAVLVKLAALSAPDTNTVDRLAGDLRAATEAVEKIKGSDADEAGKLADLLDAALTHHRSHGDGPCPVCQQGTLDARWQYQTAAQVAQLRHRAGEATAARNALETALNRARQLLRPIPAELLHHVPDGIDTTKATSAWRYWTDLATERDAKVLATGIKTRLAPLAETVNEVRTTATDRLRQLEDAWRPMAVRVQAWLETQAQADSARPVHEQVSTALSWIQDEAERLRDMRLSPFRDLSARVWAELRQESNVDLGEIAFVGTGVTRRKLNIPVRVDGVDGGVPMLSNGELHALGLALFLPRSTAPDSPFRFVIVDDPVQAMDPAKVEGLARVLHETASDRQVVVFTHDDRLADALRRLMLPTVILEVVRREGSIVEIMPNLDPVHRYLADARQVAHTARLPDDLAVIAAVGSCRDAIEAACQRVARRRMRLSGTSIAEIDELLHRAQTTNQRVALALLGNRSATGQVMATLNRLTGARWAGDTLRDVREGTHQPRAALDRIIVDSERLCDLILKTKPS
jgi:recombinational DNA repair ATPase RecF